MTRPYLIPSSWLNAVALQRRTQTGHLPPFFGAAVFLVAIAVVAGDLLNVDTAWPPVAAGLTAAVAVWCV